MKKVIYIAVAGIAVLAALGIGAHCIVKKSCQDLEPGSKLDIGNPPSMGDCES